MKKPESKIGICEYHLCKKKTKVFLCNYCKKYFCKDHINPKPILTLRQVSTAKEPLRSKLEEFWRSEKGHPDYVYTQIFWEQMDEEEKIRMQKMWEALDRLKWFEKIEPEETEVFRPETHAQKPPKHIKKGSKFRRNEKVPLVENKPECSINKMTNSLINKKMVFIYLIYFFLLGLSIYLSYYHTEHYFILITYFKYPLYLLSSILGLYIPYKLFRKFEHKEPTTDLQLWLWRFLSGILALVSGIFLFFGLMFFIASITASVGKEIGYCISIFFGCLCLGTLLFSTYLLFKYKLRSGIIIHRGE